MNDVLPDAEAVVRAWLVSQARVTDLCSTRIGHHVNETRPCLTIRRIGGIPTERRRLDQARIEVQAWGVPGASETVSLLARTARAALLDMEGQTVEGAVCTAVDDDLALTWLPDDSRDPTVPRYVFGVAVHLHP